MEISPAPVKIFYSFAEADASLLEQLAHHLSVLRRRGVITTWHKHQIVAGSVSQAELDHHLNTAELILLLVSSDFLDSDYCYGTEMQRALQRHEAKETRVIPILLRSCIWQHAPFAALEMLPTNARPITTWLDRDSAWTDVVIGISRALGELFSGKVKQEIPLPEEPRLLVRSTSPAPSSPEKHLRQNAAILPKQVSEERQSTPTIQQQTPYRRIVGLPPLTDLRAIQQREQVVEAVYTQLTQANTTAVALTGFGGVGKSTLAALVYQYTHEQLMISPSPFLSETLWLTLDSTVTFADLIGNIFESLGEPMPQLSELAPHTQAVALFTALNATNQPRLVIFDQFENLLQETGYARPDQPGVGEWLDIINSQPCRCRFLLTSRPRPIGTHKYPPTYLQEYAVEGLEIVEGVALLRKRGVDGTEEDLRLAVTRCNGHALSLSLFASLIHEHRLSPTLLLKVPTLWTNDIAQNLLDYLYTKQLNHIQRMLLVAFSVYREPASLEAVEAIITDVPKSQLPTTLQVLLVQHLIEPTGKRRYQPHAIIADYAHEHINESGTLADDEARRELHRRAAEQYRQQAQANCPLLEARRNVSDIHDLIEAIWHYCQAKQWQEAYRLIEREGVFSSLKQWGSNAILLALCSALEPQVNWSPTLSQAGTIYRYIAWAYNARGERELARKHNEQALQFYTESGDRTGQRSILDALGWSYKARGRMKRAEKYYEQAFALCEKDHLAEGHVLNGLGQVYDIQGHREKAWQCFERALALCREAGDFRLEGRTLRNWGYIHTDLGQYTQALARLEQSLSMRKTSDLRGEGVACDFLAACRRERGRSLANRYSGAHPPQPRWMRLNGVQLQAEHSR